jgi:hypothetical protein
MVTRRALLGAGALTLLAGCGPAEETEARAADVLARQLRAEQEVAAAHGAPEARSLLPATQARIVKLEAALRAEGGTPGGPVDPAHGGLEGLLDAERRALRAHVAALGELRDPKWSELLGELIAGSAAHESAVLELLERPSLPSAFPGQPVA